MENLFLLRLELLLFISSFSFCIYYVGDFFWNLYYKIKKIVVSPVSKKTKKTAHVISISKDWPKKTTKEWTSEFWEKILSEEDKLKISEIIKRIKVNTEKWYFDSAKVLIIEGLTIDKHNIDLNIELANIYEQEKNYKNAELIYKDISMIVMDNTPILSKLAYVLSMQWSYKKAIAVYETVHTKKQSDNDIIETLANLTYEIEDFEKALKYIKLVLKEKPKNVDMMRRKAITLEKLWKLKESVKVYEDILFLRPYDTNAIDNLKRLEQNIIIKK